jgi:antitoxin (DNA-binding transcriptional repressor) of toxin-antitoxin stability system
MNIGVDKPPNVLHICSAMKTATVRELRNRYSELLQWIEAGEEVAISRKGIVVARLLPESSAVPLETVSWEDSPAVRRDRRKDKRLSARQSATIRAESQGAW